MNWRFIMANYPTPSETEQDNIQRMVANLVEQLQNTALRFTNASAYCRASGWNRTAEHLTRMVQDCDHRAQMIQYGLEADQRAMQEHRNAVQIPAIEAPIEF